MLMQICWVESKTLMQCRLPYQTRSSARKTTPSSLLQTFAAHPKASKTWTPLSSQPTRPLLTTPQVQRWRPSSRMLRARHQHRRRRVLGGGEGYQLHGEEEGYLRVAVRRGGQEGVGLPEGLEEGGDEDCKVLVREARGVRHVDESVSNIPLTQYCYQFLLGI
jgi:hypothetical protein